MFSTQQLLNIPHVLKIVLLHYCEHFMDVMMCLNRDIKIRYKCQRTYKNLFLQNDE